MKRTSCKRMTALALAVVLAMALAIPAGAAETGAWKGHWAQIPMEWAAEAGLLSGGDPDQAATRAEAVTALYQYQGSPEAERETAFLDVPSEAAYAAAVSWAVEAGVLTGRTETTFAPDAPVTRQEFLTMVYRWHTAERGVPEEIGANTILTLDSFMDRDQISAYAGEAAAWAVGDLLLTGSTSGGDRVLRPKAAVTRGELAKILYQYNCAVLGNPGRIFAYDPQDVEQIMVQNGTTGERFYITDPAEIDRFLETVNGFTYTEQRVVPGAAGWFYRFVVYPKDGGTPPDSGTVYPTGVRFNNGHDMVSCTGQDDVFTEDWLLSFRPK